MKKLLLSILFSFVALLTAAQTYIALAPALTNEAGTLAGKSNLSVELGRQWDVFSIGLDLGKTSLGRMKGKDTTLYLELRPNLNVFQQGKFTNTFTAGIGVIFGAKENLMTELTSGIEYALNNTWHFNMYFGQYYYSGRTDASNVTFFGVSAMFYFSEFNGKPLIKKDRNDINRSENHFFKKTVLPLFADSLAASRMRTTITLFSSEYKPY